MIEKIPIMWYTIPLTLSVGPPESKCEYENATLGSGVIGRHYKKAYRDGINTVSEGK